MWKSFSLQYYSLAQPAVFMNFSLVLYFGDKLVFSLVLQHFTTLYHLTLFFPWNVLFSSVCLLKSYPFCKINSITVSWFLQIEIFFSFLNTHGNFIVPLVAHIPVLTLCCSFGIYALPTLGDPIQSTLHNYSQQLAQYLAYKLNKWRLDLAN